MKSKVKISQKKQDEALVAKYHQTPIKDVDTWIATLTDAQKKVITKHLQIKWKDYDQKYSNFFSHIE